MAESFKGASVAHGTVKQHSSELQNSLRLVAKSLSSRPQELRGPFVIRSVSSALPKTK